MACQMPTRTGCRSPAAPFSACSLSPGPAERLAASSCSSATRPAFHGSPIGDEIASAWRRADLLGRTGWWPWLRGAPVVVAPAVDLRRVPVGASAVTLPAADVGRGVLDLGALVELGAALGSLLAGSQLGQQPLVRVDLDAATAAQSVQTQSRISGWSSKCSRAYAVASAIRASHSASNAGARSRRRGTWRIACAAR
jgi:hypothetical protein